MSINMQTDRDVLCIGSVLWDTVGRARTSMALGSDVPGRIVRIPGGVAMNIAMTLQRFGLSPRLLSHVGKDDAGEDLLAESERLGIDTELVFRSDQFPTDSYMAIEDADGVVAAVADAHSLEAVGSRILDPLSDGRLGSAERPFEGLVALDGNLTLELLTEIARSPLFARADLRVAPASPGKAERMMPFIDCAKATLYLNLAEGGLLAGRNFDDAETAGDALLAMGASRVVITNGAQTVVDCQPSGKVCAHPPQVASKRITGAGDTFMAAHITAELGGAHPDKALATAVTAAARFVSGEDP